MRKISSFPFKKCAKNRKKNLFYPSLLQLIIFMPLFEFQIPIEPSIAFFFPTLQCNNFSVFFMLNMFFTGNSATHILAHLLSHSCLIFFLIPSIWNLYYITKPTEKWLKLKLRWPSKCVISYAFYVIIVICASNCGQLSEKIRVQITFNPCRYFRFFLQLLLGQWTIWK